MIWVCETCWIRRWTPWVAAALAFLVVQAPGSPAASQGPAVEQLHHGAKKRQDAETGTRSG